MPTATAPLSPQERGRLAHSALILRENGVDSEGKLKSLAGEGQRRKAGLNPDGSPAPQEIFASGNALANRALKVEDHRDSSAPGPTDAKFTEKLLSLPSLDDIYKAWDEATEEAQELVYSASEVKAFRASRLKEQKEYEEKMGVMLEGGRFDVHPVFGHRRHKQGAGNALYDLGREGFLAGEIDWDTAVIKTLLVDTGTYTVNLTTHKFVSSISGIIATSGALGSKTVALGVADGGDQTISAVSGDSVEAVIHIQASAVGGGADVAAGSQRAITYFDTATGLPVTPNGGDITLTYDSGSSRIFKL